MSYRTKYHNLIWNNYLNKVFDFIGLTTGSVGGVQGLMSIEPTSKMALVTAVTLCVGSFISGGTATPDFADHISFLKFFCFKYFVNSLKVCLVLVTDEWERICCVRTW